MNDNKFREIEIFSADTETLLALPYADGGIRAGFPSPAQDYIELSIDLNRELIKNKAATFVARVVGESMIDAGFHPGDLLVIDRSVEPEDGKFVVAYIDGEFTIKRLDLSELDAGIIWLRPANAAFEPIRVSKDSGFEVWGVVIYHISKDF